ncbi:DUF6370 family protein [Pedobacter steynii]|uniref:Glutaminyl-tRNA synthetase n=1 Tax=Pedobacter steynii TaxID=430522 RepID=A0A1D7QQE2_9SPHI|nr:DUF6370 family protein [Pedobacter steynii]AOM80890.1 hypothetical protein BFS30_19530 [Pedobacter steynii]
MKKIIVFMFFACFAIAAQAQEKVKKEAVTSAKEKTQVVEAACGECKFGMEGKECDLAVRIGGHAYFVDGTGLDDHGDAHAKDGFCNKIRKAEVTGKVVDGRFKATSFKLLKEKKADK